jgi:CubicO group peptidase (beta-lactamase class C family)
MVLTPGAMYNNSGYILLGYIVERTDELSQYIETTFLNHGMTNSLYGSDTKSVLKTGQGAYGKR